VKKSRVHVLVMVTVPHRRAARKVAGAVLAARAAACVNILGPVESHYWWKGKLERGGELLLLLKTRRERLEELERVVRAHHPYETPEFIAAPLTGGSASYLAWINESVRDRFTAEAR
jgi:periplasmic divalent cation tolerance protein